MSDKHVYGTTESEQEAADSLKCRQIVQEIMRFGVKQKQIVLIIKLLALSLEDNEMTRRIVNSLNNESTEESKINKLIL